MRNAVIAAALLAAAPALAQPPRAATPAGPPVPAATDDVRVNQLIVYGDAPARAAPIPT